MLSRTNSYQLWMIIILFSNIFLDNGGLPFWLKQLDPDVKIRRNDPKFMKHVEDWFDILLPKLRKYLYKNGGPVILVQIENEYVLFF